MTQLRIAFIPLLRTTFDVDYAKSMVNAARGVLIDAGFEIIAGEDVVSDLQTAQKLAARLDEQSFDLLLIFQATFADATMVTTLAEASKAPVFLWAVPEPWTGSRLRLNALCGINLASHALTLRAIKYDYGYGLPDDQAVLEKVLRLARVGSLLCKLRQARFGVVGEHPDGMDSCHLDQAALKEKFGVDVVTIELKEVFDRSRAIPADEVAGIRGGLDQHLENLSELDPKALKGTLQVYAALQAISLEKSLDGLAVRCWPEFFTELGCAACGALSMLSDGFAQNRPIPCSCEADINGTLTQFILQTLSGAPAFGTDIVGVDCAKDQIALWHCGLAPLSMADPEDRPRGTVHSNRGLPLLMDFRLKPGQITIARISRASGAFQLIVGEGEILREPKPFGGTAGTLRLKLSAERFLDALIHQGLEHHVSLTYGSLLQDLSVFADWINLPVAQLVEKEVHT